MKKLILTLIILVMLLSIASPVFAAAPSLEYMKQAHGAHGLGNVNQNFNGVEVPPPWDLPPGLLP